MAFDPMQWVQAILNEAKSADAASTPDLGIYHQKKQQLDEVRRRAAEAIMGATREAWSNFLTHAKVDVQNTGGKVNIGGTTSTWKGGGRPELEKIMYDIARRYGWSDAEARAWGELIQRESGWNPNAKNPKSTAYGLGQFLDSTWKSTGYTKSSDPRIQLEAMAKYIQQRYKTPSGALSFWQSRKPINGKDVGHWY